MSTLFRSKAIRFEAALWNTCDARFRADVNLPSSWLEALQIIGRSSSCPVRDIAEELSITIGGANKIIDRIEAVGRCVRQPHPGDRRSSLIVLTAPGRQVLLAGTSALEGELERRLGRAVLRSTLQQFMETLTDLRSAGALIDNMKTRKV